LRRKVIRDLTGQTWFKQRFGRLVARLKAGKEPTLPILADEVRRQRRWLIFNALAIAAFSAAGFWWAWFALWLLPRATWFQLVTRLRNIAEHALVAKDEPDPLRHARTTHANVIERALIAPYYVNYHCEHHMFMHTPCWSLPRMSRLLAAKGGFRVPPRQNPKPQRIELYEPGRITVVIGLDPFLEGHQILVVE
jgi:fatty acid desaturase